MSTVAPPASSAEPAIRASIARAASSVGVDFGYLYNQARIESGLDPQAKARTSSAAGLFQFTRQTWLRMVKAHGSEHGAGWAADAITPGAGGHIVSDPQMRTAIDALRHDPAFASAMAAEFAVENKSALETGLGRTAEPVDLYLAHFLGSAGAVSFLRAHAADPDQSAAPLFPAAAAANRPIFYGPGGEPRTLAQIRDRFAAKLEGVTVPTGIAPPAYAVRTTHTRRDIAAATVRAPMAMADFEPMPSTLSVDFAARAYRRLAGMGA